MARFDLSRDDRVLERQVATALLFLIPLTIVGYRGLSIGVAGAVIGLGFVLWGQLRHFRGASVLVVLAVACVVFLPALSGHAIDGSARARTLVTFGSDIVAFVALLWGRRILGLRHTALAFSLGVLAEALVNRAAWGGDAWKYALAWPVAVVLLTLGKRVSTGRRVLMLLGLGVVSVATDFRSFAGLCLLAAVLAWWRGKPNAGGKRTLRPLLVVAVAAYAILTIGTHFALQGRLGSDWQAETAAQTNGGQQSVIVGGRPEWGATGALMLDHPWGYGAGAIPSQHDTDVATEGLARLGATTTGTYVQDYMLGGRFEVHSVVGDLWVNFGLLGLALGLTCAGWLLAGLGRMLSRGGVSPLLVLVTSLALWDLAFSPISNFTHVLFAVALMLPARPVERSDGGTGGVAPVGAVRPERLLEVEVVDHRVLS